jgi:hypothetical protein
MMLLEAQFITQLLPAILPLIPPLLQLATLLIRLATGVIVAVVIPAMTLLVNFMSGLQAKFQPAIDAIRWLTSGIASLFEWLSDHLVGHSVIPDMVRSIVSWLGRLPGMALAALGGIAGALAGVIERAASRMLSAARSGVSSVVSAMRGLPGRAKAALGSLGTYLYSAGQSLMRGFVSGIKSMAGSVASAASSVLSKARNLFPHSPAKEGPFSGRGWTLFSGHAIGDALAAGMTARRGVVGAAAAGLLGTAHGALGGQLGTGVVAGGGMPVAGAGSGASAAHQRIVFDVTGADDDIKRLIRRIVNQGGGNVQSVLGGR